MCSTNNAMYIPSNSATNDKSALITIPTQNYYGFGFCQRCGVDVTRFSHEFWCPELRVVRR
ncbi:hypothetical protein BDC45DRAFT_576101 [Circinella umbellata]|nr:hypothetical protein BDC45DRAFT_576101 [Circinella umbellata]